MSEDHDQAGHDAICILATECETVLQNLIDSETQRAAKGLFEEYLQRLSTWAAYLGVFARPSQSLDHRLSNAIDIRDLVLRGLDSLGRSLTSISQNAYRFASTDIDERQTSLLNSEDDFLEIEDALEQLYRLATAIKRSSRKTVEQRASQFAENAELKLVHKLFIRTIECLYPKIDQSLQDLLSASMFDRFTKIMFLGTRQATLAARHVEQRSLSTISEELQSAAIPSPELGSLEKPKLNYSPSVQTRNRSLAPPTSLAPSKFWQHLNVGVSHLDINRTTSIAIHRSSYPPPPKPRRQELRLCEWCGEPFKSRDMNPSQWRNHIDNDVKPYICLAEHCTMTVGYPDIREWSSHMQQHNEFWYRTVYSPPTFSCPLCINNTPSFTNRNDLLQHLTSNHQSNTFDSRQLSIIADQSQGIKKRPNNECLLCGFVVEKDSNKDDIHSKRESESWSEGSTKKLKAGQQQSIPTAAIFDDREDQSHNGNIHESMARHIAAHLQTLMFLTLRIISMQKGLGSEDEDAAESNAGTNDVQDYQSLHDLKEPPSFDDVTHQSELPWLPAAETYSFNFDKERTVFIYPTLGSEDIIDTSIQFPDSFAVQETIVRLEALLATTEQNRDFYNSWALRSARRGSFSQWHCCNCSCGPISVRFDMNCPACGNRLCSECTYS